MGGGEDEPASFVDDSGRTLPTGTGEAEMGRDMEVKLQTSAGAAAAAATAAAAAAEEESSIVTASAGAGSSDVYMFSDKYRPRKPRYFNRVKTGYDWNKYNQTHYDHDNPPPKTVQGYKFNIFYPDLLDRTKAPTFFLEPADVDDFCECGSGAVCAGFLCFLNGVWI